MSTPKIAAIVEDRREIHAVAADGDYDTLCGVDFNDPSIGHMGAEPAKHGEKISCRSCWNIFITARRYSKSDFTEALRRLEEEE